MPDQDDDNRKPATVTRRFRFLCEYLLVFGWTFGLRLLPRRAALCWGTVLGTGAYFLLRSDRRVAMANLDIVFGDRRSIWFKRELALETFQRIGEVMMGLLWAPRLDRRLVARLVDGEAFLQTLRQLDASHRGVVIVTPHYGDWELACIAGGFAGYPMVSVAEPLANERIDRLLTECRTSSGNGIIPPKYALLKLVRALRSGQRVGLLCDVNGRRGRGGVWNQFFGLAIYNGVAMAELALRTKSAIVFVAAEPLRDGRLHIRSTLLDPVSTADRADDIRRVTQDVTNLVEEQVRRNPRPWLWTYKRWKRRPTEARNPYPHYSNYKRVE
ncbi:lysophospholipid acyltransferase family protein [Humisphaera borealis]|uniref:Lipid A biosynthesis acyltransferase n=1 Tax=Humisphaera borealis TaxID=2807512 RepID=A0A7M2WZ37_9BACT|nr:hypothetical protein [Humisphaera borealis]QOV90768.1 hypothetical protein IPV69_05260 [Humisphaera borealis]